MKLTEINIYPVKSTRRISLIESEVLPRGLPWDRRWMLVDRDGKFITARQHPTLAQVDTNIAGSLLTIEANKRSTLQIPLLPDRQDRIMVSIWKDQVEAVPVGLDADAWFSDYLGLFCRLVQMTDDLTRGVDQHFGQAGDEVSFADGFPLLLMTDASLEDLNKRLPNPVSMRRFRPNIVVDGGIPYHEDYWQKIRIGEVVFEGVKNCSRCVFTTVDPDTGIKDPELEPLRTLSTFRRRSEGGVFFGQNVIPRSSGVIRVGDSVEIS